MNNQKMRTNFVAVVIVGADGALETTIGGKKYDLVPRITTFDFNDGLGPVPAHQHLNGGGWVQDTARVDLSAYVGPDAWVTGNAKVYEFARVMGNAHVWGNAQVFGYAQVRGNAIVYGNAQVYGNAVLSGEAAVSGNTILSSGFVE